MKNLKKFVQDNLIEITLISIVIAVAAIFYCFSHTMAGLFIALCLFIQALATKYKQYTEQTHFYNLSIIEERYKQTAAIVFTIFKSFNYLGFEPRDQYSLCFPNDFYRITKQGIVVFRYKCFLKSPIETDLNTLRMRINDLNESNLYYEGLYVLQLEQNDSFATIVVTYRESSTEQFIKEHERTVKKNNKAETTDIADKDF